ncbi:MAG: S-adenosylmethionine:tRNA ribosyltransferase-isomerase [Myxococcales bacterium]|nr:S-adenosylmethionine:tRNA ribosyltransferase-isomerase [Myxococcales bacterium]
MTPARRVPDRRDGGRLLVIERGSGRRLDAAFADLERLLEAGDLVIVNDAATLPASLPATLPGALAPTDALELRIVSVLGARLQVVLMGAGDWRTPTERRPPPPYLPVGTAIEIAGVAATITALDLRSPRLATLEFAGGEVPWATLYAVGRPIQYAYHAEALALSQVQTAFATRPWAVEMPSAGRPLTWRMLLALRRRGVALATVTHAAGLSSTGDPLIDAALPLPERYELPAATIAAITRTKAAGGRVIAVGTTVVRAIEGAALAGGGVLRPGAGETDLVIGPSFSPRLIDGLLSGVHGPDESHYRLLAAFARQDILADAWEHAKAAGYRNHEFGDACLLLDPPRLGARAAA